MKRFCIAIAVSVATIVAGSQWRLPNLNVNGEHPVRNKVIESVKRFAEALGVAVDSWPPELATRHPLGVPSGQIVRWHVQIGEQMFVVDEPTMRIVGYFDLRMKSPSTEGSSAPRRVELSEAEAWKRAQVYLSKAGISGLVRGSARFVVEGVPSDGRKSEKWVLRFDSRPYGFDAIGVGNFVTVSIAANSALLKEWVHSAGWRYDPPHIRITKERAIQLGQKYLAAWEGPPSVSLGYVMPNEGLGSTRGPSFAAKKVSRLAYSVTIGNATAMIDAGTGDLIGGGVFGSSDLSFVSSKLKKRSTTEGQAKTVLEVAQKLEPRKAAVLLKFFEKAKLPLTGWSAITFEKRSTSTFLAFDREKHESSNVHLRQNDVTDVSIVAKVFPHPAAPIRSKSDALRRLTDLVGPLPQAAKPEVTFSTAGRFAHPKWLVGRRLCLVAVDAGKAWGCRLRFDAASGQLLFFRRWP